MVELGTTISLSLNEYKDEPNNDFVKTSTICRWSRVCNSWSCFCCKESQTKCNSKSKYFVLQCIIGLATSNTTLKLSYKMVSLEKG